MMCRACSSTALSEGKLLLQLLYGKKDKSENTSGELKTSIYKWIGAAILSEFHLIDTTATGDCVKTYKHHAVKLCTTRTEVKEDENDGSDSKKYCNFYLDADGPNENTSNEAKNIWDEILKKFPFFSELHRIFVACPNVTLIAVTTGVGPNGKKTLHLYPLDPVTPPAEFSDSLMSQFHILHDAFNHVETQASVGAVKGLS
ncbi:hypothetical protein J3A83DRAFT_4188832 [Scleroderma citrinum]